MPMTTVYSKIIILTISIYQAKIEPLIGSDQTIPFKKIIISRLHCPALFSDARINYTVRYRRSDIVLKEDILINLK